MVNSMICLAGLLYQMNQSSYDGKKIFCQLVQPRLTQFLFNIPQQYVMLVTLANPFSEFVASQFFTGLRNYCCHVTRRKDLGICHIIFICTTWKVDENCQVNFLPVNSSATVVSIVCTVILIKTAK